GNALCAFDVLPQISSRQSSVLDVSLGLGSTLRAREDRKRSQRNSSGVHSNLGQDRLELISFAYEQVANFLFAVLRQVLRRPFDALPQPALLPRKRDQAG